MRDVIPTRKTVLEKKSGVAVFLRTVSEATSEKKNSRIFFFARENDLAVFSGFFDFGQKKAVITFNKCAPCYTHMDLMQMEIPEVSNEIWMHILSYLKTQELLLIASKLSHLMKDLSYDVILSRLKEQPQISVPSYCKRNLMSLIQYELYQSCDYKTKKISEEQNTIITASFFFREVNLVESYVRSGKTTALALSTLVQCQAIPRYNCVCIYRTIRLSRRASGLLVEYKSMLPCNNTLTFDEIFEYFGPEFVKFRNGSQVTFTSFSLLSRTEDSESKIDFSKYDKIFIDELPRSDKDLDECATILNILSQHNDKIFCVGSHLQKAAPLLMCNIKEKNNNNYTVIEINRGVSVDVKDSKVISWIKEMKRKLEQ